MAKIITIAIISILILSLGIVIAYPSLSNVFTSVKKSPLPATTTVYAYGPSGLLSKQSGGETSYYHTDSLSSSALVTDQEGKVTYRSDYEPFGDSLHTSGEERYTYTGKELDSSMGLYYYGARYYDSSLGRFISSDPLSGNVYNSQRLNRYTYVLNNPMVYTDPSGMEGEWYSNPWPNAGKLKNFLLDLSGMRATNYLYQRAFYEHETRGSVRGGTFLGLAATYGSMFSLKFAAPSTSFSDDPLLRGKPFERINDRLYVSGVDVNNINMDAVNAGISVDSGNCMNCAFALEMNFRGISVSATGLDAPIRSSSFARLFRTRFIGVENHELRTILPKYGEGARGFITVASRDVFSFSGGGYTIEGHIFNWVNQNIDGTIKTMFIDAQASSLGYPTGFSSGVEYMRVDHLNPDWNRIMTYKPRK